MTKKKRNSRKTLELQGVVMGFNVYYLDLDPQIYDLPVAAGDRWYSPRHGMKYQMAMDIHPDLQFNGKKLKWVRVCSRTFFDPSITK